jgi:hypothetical protein
MGNDHHKTTESSFEDRLTSLECDLLYPDTRELRQPGLARLANGAPIISKRAQRALEQKKASRDADKK